jgi:hypothetical protein
MMIAVCLWPALALGQQGDAQKPAAPKTAQQSGTQGAQQSAQQSGRPVPQETNGMGGISSAGTFAPVYDAEKRPITAGGFVDKGTVVFEDATRAAGLDKWQHVMGTLEKKYILETDGSGVGLIDYDNAARRAVSQQPRRDVYRYGGQGGGDERPLGFRRGHRGL